MRVALPVEQLFDWHERDGALERLSPPWQGVRVISRNGGIRDGARIEIEVRANGIPTRWVMEHRDYERPVRFRDVMQSGPFPSWVHTHEFAAESDTSSRCDDTVEYTLPLGALGAAVAGGFVKGTMERVFTYRHAVLAHDIARHAAFAHLPRLRIAVTGASGFIGSQLCAFLTTGGHTVVRIGRGQVRAGHTDVSWDPARGELNPAALEGVDAVIHLAGANIAERWTDEQRAAIRDSRVQGTTLLANTIAKLATKPRVLLSGSAIGIYGSRGDELLDETSSSGSGFLADVVSEWEAATGPAEAAGVRTVHLRTGIVVGVAGGALGKQWPLFQLGVGGPFGGGQQYMSPIALDDQIGAMYHCLMDERARGAVNVVAPEAVTNAEFARQVGRAISRPACVPAPAFPVEMLFGRDMVAETLLASQRVRPTVLQELGFRWGWPTVERMVSFETGRAERAGM